jgi:hypothetical protein
MTAGVMMRLDVQIAYADHGRPAKRLPSLGT